MILRHKIKFTTISIFIVHLLLLSLVCNLQVQADATTFTNIELSHDNNWPQHVEPTMAIGPDGTIYVGYKNAYSDYGGGYQVSFTYSEDGGNTWSTAVDMPDQWESSRQSDPWMVMHQETLYYLYLEFSFDFEGPTNGSQVTMASTSDKGQTWKFTIASSNTGFADKQTFDVDGAGNIYIVYDDVMGPADYIGDDIKLALSRSFDQGTTYTENASLQAALSPKYLAPYIIAGQDAGELYATWSEFTFDGDGKIINGLVDVYFATSSDYGETWSTGSDINLNYTGDTSTFGHNSPERATIPVLEQDSTGRLYLVWAEISEPNVLYDVWMSYSDNKGSSWSNPQLVNANTAGAGQWMPDIEIDSNDLVHFAYYSDYQGNLYVKYRTFDPSTATFSDTIQVNSQVTSSYFVRPGDYLSIRVDAENTPHIVWSDARDSFMDIYYGHLAPENTKIKVLATPLGVIALVVLPVLKKIPKSGKNQ